MSIHFAVTGENKDFLKKLRESKNSILDTSSVAQRESTKMQSAFKKAALGLGAVGVGVSLKSLASELIQVTGQFQTFEAVLTNTLNSPHKAKGAMDMLSDFAATTPFQVDALTGAFVKLANQGFVPTYAEMTKLGDLASSTGKGFDQLAEAIIDAQTGEMERLKEFGIRASKEGDKVTFTFKEQKTQVDFTASAIREYILSLGSLQGVMGANAAISATLSGKVSNLTDNITQMVNEVGQSSKGALSGAIDGASYLVDNYKEIGETLAELVVVYGTYRTATMLVNAARKAQITLLRQAALEKKLAAAMGHHLANSEAIAAAKTKLLAVAQNGLKNALNATKAALATNPYTVALVAVTALAYGIYKLTTYQTDFEKSQERLKESVESTKRSIENEKFELELLYASLKNTKEGTEAYEKAKGKIQSQFGGYLSALEKEKGEVVDVADAYSLLKDKIIEANNARAYDDAMKQEGKIASDGMADQRLDIDSYVDSIRKNYKPNNKELAPLVAYLEEAEELAGKVEKDKGEYEKLYSLYRKIDKGFEDITGNSRGQNEAVGSLIKMSSYADKYQIADKKYKRAYDVKDNESGGRETPILPTYSASYTAARKEWEESKKALAQIEKEKDNFTEKAYKDAKSRQSTAKKVYEELGGVTSIKKPETEKDSKYDDSILSQLEANEKKQTELKKLGITDRRLLVIAEYDAEMAIIKKAKEEAEKLAKTEGKKFDATAFDRSEKLSTNSKDKKLNLISEEEKKEEKQRNEEVLKEFASFKDKYKALADEHDKNKADIAKAGGDTDNQAVAEEEYQEKLTDLNEEVVNSIDGFEELANQITDANVQKIIDLLKKSKEAMIKDGNGADSKEIKAVDAEINKLQNRKPDVSPSKRSLKEWQDMEEQLNDCIGSFEEIGDVVGGVAGEIISTAGSIASSTISIVSGISQLVTVSTAGMTTASTTASASIRAVESASVILAVISAVIQVAMKIAQMFNKDGDYQENIERLQGEIDNLEWELQNRDIVKMREKGLEPLREMRDILKETTEEVINQYVEAGKLNSVWDYLANSAQIAADIQKKSAEELAKVYANVSYSDSNIGGIEQYSDATEQMKLLAEQQLLIQEQINNEGAKKDIDHGYIADLEKQIEELGAEAVELINDVFEGIMGGSAIDWANDLGNALFDAAQKGEDGMVAWGEATKEIVGDIMRQLIIQQVLMPEIMKIFDKYKAKWFNDNKFVGFDAVMDDMSGLSGELNGLYGGFAGSLEGLPDELKELLGFTEGEETREASSGGGIATASQESVDENNGRLTVMQGHTYEINEGVKSLNSYASSCKESFSWLQSNASEQLKALQGIETNTAPIAEMRDEIKGMRVTLGEIQLTGLKLKK